jgi:hypothetical protein
MAGGYFGFVIPALFLASNPRIPAVSRALHKTLPVLPKLAELLQFSAIFFCAWWLKTKKWQSYFNFRPFLTGFLDSTPFLGVIKSDMTCTLR